MMSELIVELIGGVASSTEDNCPAPAKVIGTELGIVRIGVEELAGMMTYAPAGKYISHPAATSQLLIAA
jgi:hypothetical protein